MLQDDPHFIPATYFNPPVVYPEVAPWGATGATWFQGIGFLTHPLAPGVHTLTDYADFARTSNLVFDNSWTITVLPKGQSSDPDKAAPAANAALAPPGGGDDEETVSCAPIVRASEMH